MSEHENAPSAMQSIPSGSALSPAKSANQATTLEHRPMDRGETRRWWIKLFVQPLLFLACGAALFIGLGIAQRFGLLSDHGARHVASAPATSNTRYICPMMCTPPQTEPGRCPVCAMELVPAAEHASNADKWSVQIDPAARRVANIRTVSVVSMPLTRTLKAIGELNYDEGTLKTISAYVDGRLDRLYADYNGVVVAKGDHLALVYSPRLYSGQVELLLAKQARQSHQTSTLQSVVHSSHDMYLSAKRRLIELGMTETQIEQLERDGEANSRMHLCAPSSGTVIEKLAVEGEYVKEGQPIYRLADLSTVWLMLELFPEDAATIRYGQKVDAEIQSLPGTEFTGRVAFIDPNVNPKTRTVGVRVVIENKEGLLRVGDYAKATIDVPQSNSREARVFDPELANKWISPRHPHVISDAPGDCPLCGIELVPAEQFGFTDRPTMDANALVVPRDAVLMAGNSSVLYVESQPGRFEIRQVVLGAEFGDQIVIRHGVKEGEQVATRGNFLIDSQMQLVGNPSLIDPNKAAPGPERAPSSQIRVAISALSSDEQELAESQRICPVTKLPLGSMGTPIKVNVNGQMVFICCEVCRKTLLAEPDKYLAQLTTPIPTPMGFETQDDAEMDFPPLGTPQRLEPPGGLPTTAPQGIHEGAEENANEDPTALPPADLPMEVVR